MSAPPSSPKGAAADQQLAAAGTSPAAVQLAVPTGGLNIPVVIPIALPTVITEPNIPAAEGTPASPSRSQGHSQGSSISPQHSEVLGSRQELPPTSKSDSHAAAAALDTPDSSISKLSPRSAAWNRTLTQLLSREGVSGKSADVKWRVILPSGDRIGPFTPDQAISWLVEGCPPKPVSSAQAAAAADDPAAVQLCGILSSDHNAQRLPGAKFFRPLGELLPAVAAGLKYAAVTKADIAKGVPTADWNRLSSSSQPISTRPNWTLLAPMPTAAGGLSSRSTAGDGLPRAEPLTSLQKQTKQQKGGAAGPGSNQVAVGAKGATRPPGHVDSTHDSCSAAAAPTAPATAVCWDHDKWQTDVPVALPVQRSSSSSSSSANGKPSSRSHTHAEESAASSRGPGSAGTGVNSSSDDSGDRKTVFYGPSVCHNCGDRGHGGAECSTPFCMSCDVWGHAKGQCADACPGCTTSPAQQQQQQQQCQW
eukprot:GHUV01015027.1.p1 GENE.GHUV01015027.1~~GHUV01015027.1.p1  ORF type:complete len:505 (+),score=183.87 GHUV01015027.1:84-1517(+)